MVQPVPPSIRLGSGAGYSGDRIEPAVELARHGDIDYLIFECLAERTIALAQQAKARNPAEGFDPLLKARMRAVLPDCLENGVRIITNMGAANPVAAAHATAAVAAELGLHVKIAAVLGDDVVEVIRSGSYVFEETGSPVASVADTLISANAYLGVEAICRALATGAHVVITGRAGDPALFMAPLVHEFGWAMDDWTRLGQGVVVGHLLECAGQVTGGYFADPGYKDVPDLARLGFPIGEVSADGTVVISKLESAGGYVNAQTCKEQLLYEIHDPRQYFQPDVVADFSRIVVEEVGIDRVRVTGGAGAPATGLLKVSVGYIDSFLGEGQMSYAGAGAAARARLALEIVRERLKLTGVMTSELRFDLIGIDSLHGASLATDRQDPYEVRVRVAGRTASMAEAIRIGNEVETLYTNGPAGGGGATRSAREIVAVQSVLMSRDLVTTDILVIESPS